MRPPLLCGAVVVSLLASGACWVNVDSQAEIVREEKRFALAGVPDLRLTTFDGSIEIRSWDRPEVLVEVEKRGPTREAVDALEVRATQDGDRIDVEVLSPRSETRKVFGFDQSPSAKLIVSVPARSDIAARTGDGSIRLERVTGRVELRTGDGSIRTSGVDGDVTLHTGDGSVSAQDAVGSLQIQTGDGSVTVAGALRSLRIRTGDGSIVLRVQDESAMTDDWDLSTGDGSVTLYLPDTFGAELDAETGDGRIHSDLEVTGSAGGERRRALRGRLGGGGPHLRVRTNDGSIRIRRS